jgi:predicted nucleic acid-binding Zn ribbon protein
MQGMRDPHPTGCPSCHAKDAVEQLLSAPAVQFKGSGFYSTDYGRKSSSPAGKSGEGTGGDSKSGEKKTEVKADSGGEKKTESKKSDSSDKK